MPAEIKPQLPRSLVSIAVPRKPQAAVVSLSIVGLAMWLALPAGPSGLHASLPLWRWILAGIAGGFASLPAMQMGGTRLGRWLVSPSIKGRTILSVAVALAASSYFLLTALNQDRDLFAKTHDECSYMIQMRMLATGHLWMPRHELADFFDSFYLLSKPVYASMYFPGTAMLFVPALWLHWPTWVIPILVAGAIVGWVYRLVTEWVDGVMGMMAALLIVSLSWYRMVSVMLLSQLPLLLLGLVMIWAWSRWRSGGFRMGWILLIGACAGWAAITRPLDALCFAGPVGVAVGSDLYGQTTKKLKWMVMLALIAGAMPFLIVQLVFNRGATGSVLQSPFGMYAQRDLPGTSYGFHRVPSGAEPESIVPQKKLLYAKWVKLFVVEHHLSHMMEEEWQRRIPLIVDVVLPARPLLLLLPVGLLGLRDRRRWLLLASFPLFILGYVGYTFYLEHYAVVVVPAVVLLVVMGLKVLGEYWPRLVPGLMAVVVSLALTNLYETNKSINDEPFRSTWLRQLHESNEANSIVLFTFDLDPNDPDLVSKIAQEPVYNTDVAWPDDAPLIRAHDLGARNIELFRYYATHGPDRMVYRFSRKTGRLDTLGKAKDLCDPRPGS